MTGKLYDMRVHRRQDMIIQTVAIVNPDLSVDFSNYWTAAMYFKHQNGSYKRVPIYPNAQLGYEGQNADHIKGGMTIYYTQKDFNSSDLGNPVRAFPPISNWAKGFRMTVGNPSTTTINGTKKGLAYTCLQTILTRGYETPDFPKEPCPAGIMAIQSHMFSTTLGGFRPADPCPASHPIKMPQLAYETMWNTTAFADMWPTDGSQPFVWSYSDSRGYGTHADYVFGWKGDSLQRVMNDSCMFHYCGSPGMQGVLKTQTVEEMNACAVESSVDEDVEGWLDHLPGYEMEA
ncbi:hypothetical protein J4E82_010837 [Alternaria postmessia]|uniref:uncharacterized protein n=1 Tax=Alternaria postmessia TaxID=1187938 RepID=UPI0022245075|nr:uncharacterized protein J4E82_010837 [Alternaria postmessia]KAI5367061.1 hypothetical protein J4E82_010837 [Alternaria postmessia]